MVSNFNTLIYFKEFYCNTPYCTSKIPLQQMFWWYHLVLILIGWKLFIEIFEDIKTACMHWYMFQLFLWSEYEANLNTMLKWRTVLSELQQSWDHWWKWFCFVEFDNKINPLPTYKLVWKLNWKKCKMCLKLDLWPTKVQNRR